jgi:hypothetical protein
MDPLTLKAASFGAGDRLEAGVEVAKKVGPSRFDELSQKVAGDPVTQSSTVPFEPQTTEVTSPANLASTVNNQLHVTGASLQRLNHRVQAASQTTEVGTIRTLVEQLSVRFTNVGDSIRQVGVQQNPQNLLAMQAKIYQISEDVELLSKMVDQATSGVKSVLQIQVG